MKRILILMAALAALSCAEAFAQTYVPTPVTVSKEKVKLNGKVYLSHVVLERQTIYGITKAYGVTEEELYEANPTLRETGLQKNAILLVPYREQAPVTTVEPAPEADPAAKEVAPDVPVKPVKGYIEHTVRWYEDIDDIARRYEVSVKEIMDANGLSSRKLSTRQVLKIPVHAAEDEAAPETPQEEPDPVVVETQPVPDEQPAPEEQQVAPIEPRSYANFSLVLPLKAGELNMDFYSGVLMALRDMEDEGLKAHVHVYDLSTGIPPIDELVKDDFVLGPVASRDLEAILQRVDGRVPVISPLDQKAGSLSTNYANFIQAPSAVDYQYEDLAAWVKEDLQEGEKIVLITEKGATNINASVAIRSAMAKEELSYEILSYAIVEGRGISGTLNDMLSPKGHVTRVVVASESEAFVGDVVRNLTLALGKGNDIVMYAPAKVRTFDTIDGTSYHNASLHVSATYHIDYDSPAVSRFVKTYRALFRTEPTPFAFQGYDTARYFVSQVLRCGKAWTAWPAEERSSGLHTDFLLVKDENGNLHNEAVRRIVFEKDYTTSLQRQ